MFTRLLQASILELLGVLVGVLVSICVGIWLIVRIRARYQDREDPAAVDHEMLIEMGELYRQGDLSDEEFRSIKGRLVERIDDSMRKRTDDG